MSEKSAAEKRYKPVAKIIVFAERPWVSQTFQRYNTMLNEQPEDQLLDRSIFHVLLSNCLCQRINPNV